MSKGYTLVEVIISIALVCMLILAITGLSSMSVRMSGNSQERDEVFNIARGICELYKSNTSFYSSVESEVRIYKYVDSISDIQDINDLISNKDGYYSDSDYDHIIGANNVTQYTVLLEIKRLSNEVDMEALNVEVVKNNENVTRISLTAAK